MGFITRLEAVRSSPTFAICTVTVAIFVDLFLYGLVIPILPQILANQAHVPKSDVQINLSGLLAAYNASVIICAPLSGLFADRWSSRKLPFIGGLVALAGATVLFMLSTSLGLLYLARVLQGASAAIVWAVGLALLVDVLGSDGIGAAMGWTSLGLSLGNTVGPLIGGVVYQQAGRYATFSVAFGAIAVDVLLRILLKEPSQRKGAPAVVRAEQELPSDQAVELAAIGGEPVGAQEVAKETATANEVRQESAKAPSNLPAMLQLLTHGSLVTGLCSVFLVTLVLTGLEAVIPLHVETTFSWTSRGAGLIFLGIVIPIFLSPLIGMLYDRHGASLLSMLGFATIVIAGPLLAIVRLHTIGLIVLLVILLVILGVGISLVMTPQMAEISIFSDKKAEEDPGLFGPRGATAQCCALMTVATAAGGVVGPIITGAVNSTSGWTSTSVVVGAFAAAGLLCLLGGLWFAKEKKAPGTDAQPHEESK